MTKFRTRYAHTDDAAFVIDCLVRMMQEVVEYGGHPVTEESVLHERMTERWEQAIGHSQRVFIVAEPVEPPHHPVGVLAASVVELPDFLEPLRSMHIHTLYVVEDHRNHSVGALLLEAGLDWGKEMGCVEVDLHVLDNNPARRIYERMGFRRFQTEFRRAL